MTRSVRERLPTARVLVSPLLILTHVFTAWASALFFEVAGIATVLLYFRPMPTPRGTGGPALGRLDPAYLRELWAWNRTSFPWFLLIDASICFVRPRSHTPSSPPTLHYSLGVFSHATLQPSRLILPGRP